MGLVEVTREVEATEKTKRRAMEEERRALAARMEYHARRATETARALAEAREALETSSRDARAERERADAATAACQSLRRELGRARKLNIDAERNARHELERGAKARKALVEMVHEARRETREAKTAVKETSERAQMLEEWAKRRDAAANAVATRLRRSLQDCAALARRVKVITEENVKLRRRAARDRSDLFDANEYSERLEADWISRDGENIVVRNPIFVDASADEQYGLWIRHVNAHDLFSMLQQERLTAPGASRRCPTRSPRPTAGAPRSSTRSRPHRFRPRTHRYS